MLNHHVKQALKIFTISPHKRLPLNKPKTSNSDQF